MWILQTEDNPPLNLLPAPSMSTTLAPGDRRHLKGGRKEEVLQVWKGQEGSLQTRGSAFKKSFLCTINDLDPGSPCQQPAIFPGRGKLRRQAQDPEHHQHFLQRFHLPSPTGKTNSRQDRLNCLFTPQTQPENLLRAGHCGLKDKGHPQGLLSLQSSGTLRTCKKLKRRTRK